MVETVRSRVSAPATTLPVEFVNATRWNQPSRTSTLIGAVGATSLAASVGRNFSSGAAGGFDCSACWLNPPKQEANRFGAMIPTARVVKARRRLTDGRPRAG